MPWLHELLVPLGAYEVGMLDAVVGLHCLLYLLDRHDLLPCRPFEACLGNDIIARELLALELLPVRHHEAGLDKA